MSTTTRPEVETFGGLTLSQLRIALPDETVDEIAAIAGTGISYWAREATPAEIDLTYREHGEENVDFVFTEFTEFGAVDVERVHSLSRDAVRQAYGRVLDLNQRYVARYIHNYVIESYRGRDESGAIETADIDSEAADVIFQVAAFGEVIYG